MTLISTCRKIFSILAVVSALAVTLPVSAKPSVDLPRPDMVLVEKSEKKMYLMLNGRIIREYPIVLGKNPVGHKIHAGDGRTPEGVYELTWKNPDSRFYRSINISYPNELDAARAQAQGLEPGDLIMIHGSPNWVPSVDWAKKYLQRKDWTEGCIAVTNDIMDEIWDLISEGTPIRINP